MKRTIIVAFTLVLFSSSTICQSIIRSSIGSMGSTLFSEGLILKQTIGQSSPTTKLKNNHLTLRQGFQQAIAHQKSSKDMRPIDFAVYPNPASIACSVLLSEDLAEYEIQVSQLTGEIVYIQKQLEALEHILSLDGFKPGIYIIQLKTEHRIGTKKLLVIE